MPEKRDRWSTRTAFIMAAVGSAVGLGNVWRFPYVAYANGGGAFFIPYFVALLTAGIPLMILEFGLGQKMQASAPAALGRANKHTEWVGWFALLVGTVISCYYAVIMAYAVEYLVYSVKGLFSGGAMPWSDPSLLSGAEAAKGTPAEVNFFLKRVVENKTAAEVMWRPVLHLVLALAFVWSAVFWIVYKGVKRVGRVVMWTVPLPVVLLIILAIRGLTLPGAGDGIAYYLTPDFSKLGDPGTWLAAYGQVFFSLTIGFGVMIAYASYRPTDTDVTNNAFITSFANCATSFLAGFAVFSVLGFLAHAKGGVPVEDVVAIGPGLAFITYPTAISQMGGFWPPIIAVAFFVMLLTLGIDSLFSLVEGVVAGLHDRYPSVTRGRVTAAMCGGAFLVGGLVFANRAGLNWLDIVDHWANDYGLAVVGLLQCLIIGYLFHTDDLRDYVNRVSEIKLWGWWELCVRLLAPGVLVYLLASQFVKELGRGEFYGATGSDFDVYLWVAPAIFAFLFVAAFALSRKWTNLKLVAGGAVVFLLTLGLLAALMPRGDFSLKIRAVYDTEDPRKVTLRAESPGAPVDAAWRWQFPDGSRMEGREVAHVFGDKGEYAVSLVVAGGGREATAERTVYPAPLVRSLSVRTGWHHELVKGAGGLEQRLNPLCQNFKATLKGAEDPVYKWDFGDGSGEVESDEPNVRHFYAKPGKYTAKLRVDDRAGSDRDETKTIEVNVPRFVARAKADRIGGPAPLLVRLTPEVFRAVPSEKPGKEHAKAPERVADLSGYRFSWDLDDGHKARGPQVEHVFQLRSEETVGEKREILRAPDGSAAGEVLSVGQTMLHEPPYDVRLIVEDGRGGDVGVVDAPSISPRPASGVPASAALLCALGATILFGGLAVCLAIARRGRAAGDEPEFDTEAATRIAPALTEKDYEEYVAGKGGGGAEPSPEDDLA